MKLGIISDTHDRLEMILKAVDVFNGAKVDLVIHAGDYVSPFTASAFRALEARIVGVFGNNDGDRTFLRKRFQEIGAEIKDYFALVDAGGTKVGVLHGQDGELLETLSSSEAIDVLICGHTHNALIERKGKVLLVNSGEASGYLSGRSTVAILETRTQECRLIELSGS